MSDDTKLDDLKSLETLCRLNEQANKFIKEILDERLKRDDAFREHTEKLFNKLFSKIEEVKKDMGNFRNEIDERVERCNKKMQDKLDKHYVTKPELDIMTRRILARITIMGSVITVAILVAKFLFPEWNK